MNTDETQISQCLARQALAESALMESLFLWFGCAKPEYPCRSVFHLWHSPSCSMGSVSKISNA